jgi:hypothetical protein
MEIYVPARGRRLSRRLKLEYHESDMIKLEIL